MASEAQWKRRVRLVQFAYALEVTDMGPEDALRASFEDNDFDAEQTLVAERLAANRTAYAASLAPLLRKDWRWDRLPVIERAIMIETLAEHEALRTPPAVLLDQAATTARHFTDEEGYKFVNGILDAHFKASPAADEKP